MIGKLRIKGPTAIVAVLLSVSLLASCQAPASTTTSPTSAPATSAAATGAPAAAATSPSAPQPATTAPAAAAPTQAPQVLKIGVLLSQTGPTSRTSVMAARTHEMVMDDINAKGGLKVGDKTYRLEYVRADDKCTADGGREAADRLLLAEKVKIIIGPGSMSPCAGAQPSVEQAKALMVGPGCLSTDLIGPKHPTTLAVGTPYGSTRIGAINNWVAKTYPQLKRVGILSYDDATGKMDTAAFAEVIKAAGLQVVDTEFFPTTTTDFSPIITRLLAQKPEIVEIASSPAAAAAASQAIVKALSEQNFKGPILGGYTSGAFLGAGAAAEGYVAPVPMERDAAVLPAAVKEFNNRFVQKYGEADFDVAVVFYNSLAGQVLFPAISKAGTVDDTAKIADVMRSNQWDTTLGKLGFGGVKTFGAPSVLESPPMLTKVQGGKFVTFEIAPGSVP